MVLAMPVAAGAQSPTLPHYFYGTVTVNGTAAPAGTTIEAMCTGVVNDASNPITITQPGVYGSANPLASVPRLLVQGTITDGATIEFYINGFKANETSTWHEGQTEVLNLTVNTPLIVITTTLPGGVAGSAYSQTLAASGGTGPYTWAITAGALPAGLNLNANTGVISGTPTAAGIANFTVQVTDDTEATDTQDLSITISAFAIITTTLPDGTTGQNYSQTLAAAGGTSPYTWAITAGALPAGLNLNTATGVVSGTPSAAGVANFTVQVTDSLAATANKNLAITINTAPLSIATAVLPDGIVTVAYSQTLTAAGGTSPYTWAITAGTLPVGYSINAATGVISGTTNSLGTSSFTVRVTDSLAATATRSLSINIAPIPALSITTTSLSSGTVGAAYSRTLAAAGGVSPYTWAITSGALPVGLTLNGNTGIISGTPTTIQTTSFTVQVTDSKATAATQNLAITINPVPGAGGGGGGGPAGITFTTPGLYGTVPIVNTSGILQNNVTLTTPDGSAVIHITAGTKMIIDAGNSPIITSIAAAPTAQPPSPPPGNIIVLAYTFEPSGAQFTPPLSLTMSYDPAKLPAGVEPGDLVIAYWNGTRWVNLDSNINPGTNTITAKVEHFTEFAILGDMPEPEPTPAPATSAVPTKTASTVPVIVPSPSATAVLSPTPTAVPASPAAPATTQPVETAPVVPATQPWNWVLIVGLVVGVLLIVAAITFTLRKRNAK